MATNAIIARFFDALTKAEEPFIATLGEDAIGVLLRSVVSELDWYHYNFARKEEEVQLQQQEHFYILRLGAISLIRNSLASRDSFIAPALSLVRTPESAQKTLEIASALGMIDHGRRLAQCVIAGIASIEEAQTNHFDFTLPTLVPDDEFYERAVSDYYLENRRLLFQDALDKWLARNHAYPAEVNALLARLVRPWGHWIAYESDIFLDQHFYSRAFVQLQFHDGYDTYAHTVKFGGISIEAYFTALTYVLSLALKHVAFAEALLEKEPGTKLENILTISADSARFVEDLRDAVNFFGSQSTDFVEIDIETAKKIFHVLSVGRENIYLLNRPGCPIPLLVRNTETGVIKCISGITSNPVLFLLESLRYHFPNDYNENQQLREKSLQSAIKRSLQDFEFEVAVRENTKVKISGRVRTDIDIAATDLNTGMVLLCQLKHQEIYGNDLHARWTRYERLKKQAKSWFETVEEWLDAVGERGLRSSLQVPNSVPQLKVRKLIISRHYASSVQSVLPDERCGGVTWMQFLNALNRSTYGKTKEERCLDAVFATIRENAAPGGTQHLDVPPDTTWHLPGLTISSRHEPRN